MTDSAELESLERSWSVELKKAQEAQVYLETARKDGKAPLVIMGRRFVREAQLAINEMRPKLKRLRRDVGRGPNSRGSDWRRDVTDRLERIEALLKDKSDGNADAV